MASYADFQKELEALSAAGGNKPTDIAAIDTLLNSASKTIGQSKVSTIAIKQQVTATVNKFAGLTAELQAQVDASKALADKSAAINKQLGLDTAAASVNPINTYQQQVSGTKATEVRTEIGKDYIDAQNEYNTTVEDIDASNPIVGFFKRAFVLPFSQQKLQAAQQNLQTNNQIVAASTGNLFESIKAARVIAGQRSANESEKVAYDQAIVGNMISALSTKKDLTKEEIGVYASQLQIQDSILNTAIKEIQLAKEGKGLSAAGVQDIMARAQLTSFLEDRERQAQKFETLDKATAANEKYYEQYLTSIGREKDVGKITYESKFILNGPNLADPDVAGFVSFMKYNVSNKSPFVDAMIKAETGAPRTIVENNAIATGEKMAQDWNNSLLLQIEKIPKELRDGDPDVYKAAKDEILSQRLNPKNKDDWAKISTLVTKLQEEANVDATDAIQSGAMVVPDMKAALTDPAFAEFQALVPKNVQDMLLSEDFKNIDLSVKSGDPGASVTATFSSIVDQIEKISSAQGSDISEATSTVLSQGMAGYYKAVRQHAVNEFGFRDLEALKVSGVDSAVATGWTGGTTKTTKVNLENAGEIKTILMNTLRQRRVHRKQKALSDNTFTGGLTTSGLPNY